MGKAHWKAKSDRKQHKRHQTTICDKSNQAFRVSRVVLLYVSGNLEGQLVGRRTHLMIGFTPLMDPLIPSQLRSRPVPSRPRHPAPPPGSWAGWTTNTTRWLSGSHLSLSSQFFQKHPTPYERLIRWYLCCRASGLFISRLR